MQEALAGEHSGDLASVNLEQVIKELDEELRQARLFLVHKIDKEVKELRQARFKLKHTLTHRGKKPRDK